MWPTRELDEPDVSAGFPRGGGSNVADWHRDKTVVILVRSDIYTVRVDT